MNERKIKMAKFIESTNGIRIPVDLMDAYGIDTFFPEDDLEKVNKHTRAGKNGKLIVCPECHNVEKVYHFAWNATVCPKCKKTINKYDYFISHRLKK